MIKEVMKRIASELRYYNPLADKYKGEFIHKVWAAEIEEALAKQEQEVDWKDMYEKEKRRSAMWIAKYEKDIGPLEYAVPAKQEQGEPVKSVGDFSDWLVLPPAAQQRTAAVGEDTRRAWIGLTDEEIERDYYGRHDFVRAIELRIKEKNT